MSALPDPALDVLLDDLDESVRRAAESGVPLEFALAAAHGHVLGLLAALIGGGEASRLARRQAYEAAKLDALGTDGGIDLARVKPAGSA